jgi:hypothetical protein
MRQERVHKLENIPVCISFGGCTTYKYWVFTKQQAKRLHVMEKTKRTEST